MTHREIFQTIANIVSSAISEPWEEVNVEAELDDELADLCVWYFTSTGDEKYFAIPRELADCFVELRKITGDDEKGYWSKCLFTMTNDGKFNTDFSYEPPRWA